MKQILTFTFILLFSFSFGQGLPDPGVNLRNEGKYDESINHYLKQKKKGYWDWGNKYNYAKVLAQAGKIDSCFFYLNENIDENISKQSLIDIEFIGIKEDKRWTIYEKKVINKHLPSNDVSSSAQIYRIIALSEKDENNINLLFKLVNKKGWPKRSQVGEATDYIFGRLGNKDLFITKSKKYIKELKELCINGEINCEYFAELYDNTQKNSNKPQKYGTIYNIDYDNNRKKNFYKLIDEKRINKWRTEIGLKHLEEFSK